MLPNILNALHPCAVAASLEPLDKADPPTDLQAILERAYVDVLAHEFQRPGSAARVKDVKCIALAILQLAASLRMQRRFYLLHTSSVKLDCLMQHPFGVDLCGLGTVALGPRNCFLNGQF